MLVDYQPRDVAAFGPGNNQNPKSALEKEAGIMIFKKFDSFARTPAQQSSATELPEADTSDYFLVLAGATASPLTDEERLNRINEIVDDEALIFIARHAVCDKAGLAALNRINNETSLTELAAESVTTTLRSAAAHRITDPALLEQLATRVRDRDKAVYKYCRDKLQVVQKQNQEQESRAAQAREACASLETLAAKPPSNLTQAQYDYNLTQWQKVAEFADSSLGSRVASACAELEKHISAYNRERAQVAQAEQRLQELSAAFQELEAQVRDLKAPVAKPEADRLELALAQLDTVRHQPDGGEIGRQAEQLARSTRQFLSAFNALEARAGEIEQLKQQIQAASPRDTAGLASYNQRLSRLSHKGTWPADFPDSVLSAECKRLEARLARLSAEHKAWQAQSMEKALANIELLTQKLESGQTDEAQRTWDRIQSAAKHADGPDKALLQEKLAPLKPALAELKDWKSFAATEKKKELIAQMRHLLESRMHAPDKAKHIRNLHDSWKALGHVVGTDPLWADFKTLSDRAYEPCKEYFKQRKAKLKLNLDERTRICTQLEELLTSLGEKAPEQVNVASLNKIESQAVKEWKQYAPVEQSRIKQLQKRFNSALNQLRQQRHKALQVNSARKAELVARAHELVRLSVGVKTPATIEESVESAADQATLGATAPDESVMDLNQAISEAKTLQRQWKDIGPSSFKEDRKYWKAFREACDRLFEQRDQEKTEQRRQMNKQIDEAQKKLGELSLILQLPDRELAESRKRFNDAKADVHALVSRIGENMRSEKKQILGQLSTTVRQFEGRLKKLPDRKTMALQESLKARASFCAGLEQKLLAGKELEDPASIRQEWDALDKSGDADIESRMERRFQNIIEASGPEQYNKMADARLRENELTARRLCVEMEISCQADSPASDQGLRMELQLEHLKKDFGQNINAGKSPAKMLNELELQLISIGPLEEATRRDFEERVAALRKRE